VNDRQYTVNEDGTIEHEVMIRNKRGLHARAAARFVKLAGQYDANITVTHKDTSVSGRSIMGLMMLAAGPGSPVLLSARGRDAVAAIAALARLVESKFDED
jgi:phosphocarrier protein HPr